MGTRFLGRTALIAAIVGIVGLSVGINMFWDAFCFLSCREDEQQSTDPALAVIGASLLLDIAALTVSIIAFRRRFDRGWALAGIYVASLPLAAAVLLYIGAILLFGFA